MEEVVEHNVRSNEGVRTQKASICLLCGKKGIPLYQNLRDCLFCVPGVWTLVRCLGCRLVWLNPRPIPEDVRKLYTEYFTHVPPRRVNTRLTPLRRAIKRAVLASAFGYKQLAHGSVERTVGRVFSWVGPLREMVGQDVRWLDAPPGRRRRLLDVGCGNGRFLARMLDLGWKVVGVEPDHQAVNVAWEKLGDDVFRGTLEEASFLEESFDAITMNHVIEHLWDPVSTLKECHRLLKSGGRLVVVTPNLYSLAHKLFREAWRGLEPPRHFFVFSSHSLQACAKRAGLRVLKLSTTARLSRNIWASSRLVHQKGGLPGGSLTRIGWWLRLEGLAFQAVEHGYSRFRDVGEEIVMVATK